MTASIEDEVMRRTLLVPDIDGSCEPNWRYWWAGIGPSSSIGDQEDWAKPFAADWVGKVARVALDLPGSILVAGRNDASMPIDGDRRPVDDREARFLDLGFAGHVNAASGFGPWPQRVRMRDGLARDGRPSTRLAASAAGEIWTSP